MSDISTSANPIQFESVQYQAPVSESALSSMGAAINYCLKKLIPVGTVMSSMLDQTQFNSEVGVGYWQLCDGTSVVGSRYSTLTGNTTVPDFRGVFLRMKNNGRSDNYSNTAGDLSLGALEVDRISDHTHTLPFQYDNTDHGSLATGQSPGYQQNLPTGPILQTVGGTTPGAPTQVLLETAPKSATVNYFIRVN